MAELVDAQASGACGGNIVRVRFPFPAVITLSYFILYTSTPALDSVDASPKNFAVTEL